MKEDRVVGKSVRGAGSWSYWQWAALHGTGLLLAVFLFLHIWSVHYAGGMATDGFTFAGVSTKLRSPVFRFFDFGLLVLALFHGLVGTRRVSVDLGLFSAWGERALDLVLLILGIAGLWYGWSIYQAFL